MCILLPGITPQETLQRKCASCFLETLLKSLEGVLLIDGIDSVLKVGVHVPIDLIDEDHTWATNFPGTDSAMHFIFRILCSIIRQKTSKPFLSRNSRIWADNE